MASGHGSKPPDPRGVPKQHGRRPPAPRPHKNSGSSSTGSRAMVWVAVAVWSPPVFAFLAAAGWLIMSEVS